MNTKKCKNCEEDFIIHKGNKLNVFCSMSCSTTFNNKLRGKPTDETKQKVSLSLKKYRKEHPDKFPSGINHSKKIGMATKNKYNDIINSIMDVSSRTASKILKRLDLGCCICGWKDGTCDIHHINGRKIQNPDSHDNLTYICPNHHRLIHLNKISKKDLIPLSKYLPLNWTDSYYG